MTKAYKYGLFLLIILFSGSCEIPEIGDNTDVDIDVTACVPEFEDSQLDVVTWNLKDFPVSRSTINYLDDLIEDLDADVIAIQEIESLFALTQLLEKLPEWNGLVFPGSDQRLGFIYNSSTIQIEPLTGLFKDNDGAFPRPAVMTRITHIPSDKEVTLINVHLKCCEGQENMDRRKNAATMLMEFVNREMSEEPVIILGNFNEVLRETTQGGSFSDIISDLDNFAFVDFEIAMGPMENWSFPSWPSHIDHILITNELFLNVTDVGTILFESCFSRYSELISDHRPLYLSLEF